MKIKSVMEAGYVVAIMWLGLLTLLHWVSGGQVLEMAQWAPAVGIIAVISGQTDLLSAIEKGGDINLRARVLDFLHWLLLIGINIGAWLTGSTNLAWFVLKITLLGIIGWQIGIGYNRRAKRPTQQEQMVGLVAGVTAVCLGLGSGLLRALDQTNFGWGWWMETITATMATVIVLFWIANDLQTMRQNPYGYPRSLFLKGLVNNGLVLWFWVHVMVNGGEDFVDTWLTHLGLTVNILVGNLAYAYYYASYEYYCHTQKVTT